MKKLANFWALGHIKPAIILPLIALICVLGGAIFWYVGPETKAQVSPSQPNRAALRTFLFQGAFVPVGRDDADPEDALYLATVFEQARKSFYEDGRTVDDKPGLKRHIAKETAEALEEFAASKPFLHGHRQCGISWVSITCREGRRRRRWNIGVRSGR